MQDFDKWVIDFVGPSSQLRKKIGARYIITATDYLKKWANDKNNFKGVSEKSSNRKSSRYPKSSISKKVDLKLANISCCSVSSDGSTEASHRCDYDAYCS